MSSGQHIHVIDNKQIAYPNNNCPICGTGDESEERQSFVPKVYTKGRTVVIRPSKATMGTITWWETGKAFLITSQRMRFDNQRQLIRESDGSPAWEKLTYRLNVPLLNDLLENLIKLRRIAIGIDDTVPKRD